jgi:hypothetical protein
MIRKTLAIVAGTITISACSVYHPQAVDIPLMTQQGETKIEASGSLSGWIFPDATSLNVTATHAFTDCLAGQAHLNYGSGMGAAQLAFGAFKPFGDHAVLEGYMGLNSGYMNVDNRSTDEDGTERSKTYSYDGHFNVPFSQINFGWHDLTRIHIDIGFGFKAGAYMPNINYYEYDKDEVKIDEKTYHYTTPNMLLEPQFALRLGSKKVKWSLKAGFCYLNDIAEGAQYFTYDFYTLSTGLQIKF